MAGEFEALQKKLNALRTKDLQRVQRKALTAVGDYLEGELVEAAPVKAESARGVLQPDELKRSIRKRVSVPSDAALVQGARAKVVVGPTGQQVKLIAADVEYGHSNPRAGKGKLKETPPHPFIRPTKERTQAQALQIYTGIARAEISRVMKQ